MALKASKTNTKGHLQKLPFSVCLFFLDGDFVD